MTLAEMLADLPYVCDIGVKRDAKGYQTSWRGYKLHLDVADGAIPVSCLLTSASLHDSQAAIPLATLTAGRVRNLYDPGSGPGQALMDSAYDAPEIRAVDTCFDHRRQPPWRRVQAGAAAGDAGASCLWGGAI